MKKRVKRDLIPFDINVGPSDPLYSQMWYLNPNSQTDHMNITAAWAQGITGKGVVVSILDDGLETSHPDLIKNYDSKVRFQVHFNRF